MTPDPKGDEGAKKAPLHLLPSFPLHEASWVLKHGGDKYGPWNWRENAVKTSTYRAAMQRHLDQWFDGLEDADSETGRSHLAHVIASAAIVMDAAKHGTLVDDRPRGARPKGQFEDGFPASVLDTPAVPFSAGQVIPWRPRLKVILPDGRELEVPEPPKGFCGVEVLPKNKAPFSDETALSPDLALKWTSSTYNHYGERGPSRPHTLAYSFLVAHKTNC